MQDFLPEDLEYRWASEANRLRVCDELEAVRLAESIGYYHRVELHCRQALDLFRKDLAENIARSAPKGCKELGWF